MSITPLSTSLDALLSQAVADGIVPNVVGVIADSDGPLYDGAVGALSPGSPTAVGPDAIFRLASMTKLVTTAGALRLVDEGRLDLDAPVEQYRPEFADLQVLERMDGNTPVLRPPASQATVRQLASHTSGLCYWFWNADLVQWEAATGHPERPRGRREKLSGTADSGSGERRSSTGTARTGSGGSSNPSPATRSTCISMRRSSTRWE